jgi:hypothetical protein
VISGSKSIKNIWFDSKENFLSTSVWIYVLSCCCVHNSISILILCGRVLQFTFDWMFDDGHGPYCNVEESASHISFTILVDLKSELSLSRMLFLADPYAAAPYSIAERINASWIMRITSWSTPQRSSERHFRTLSRFIALAFTCSSCFPYCSLSSKIIPRILWCFVMLWRCE